MRWLRRLVNICCGEGVADGNGSSVHGRPRREIPTCLWQQSVSVSFPSALSSLDVKQKPMAHSRSPDRGMG